MSDTVIRVENISKLYRLGEVGTGSLAHDVNRWWHKVRGKEDPYLKIGEVNDRTKPTKQAVANSGSRVTSENQPAEGGTGAQGLRGGRVSQAVPQGFAGRENSEPNRAAGASGPATSYSPPVTPKAPPSDWVYALKDVSFQVKRGRCLGSSGGMGRGRARCSRFFRGLRRRVRGRSRLRGALLRCSRSARGSIRN